MGTDRVPVDQPEDRWSTLDEMVDEAEEESFPASDPPSSWAGVDVARPDTPDRSEPDGSD